MKWLTGVLLSLALALPAHAQETIVVYFQKGFYPAEDKAVDELVEKFQKKTGVKVEISRYAPQEMIPKTVAALDSGSPPDMVYGDVFDFQVAGKWAFEGRLEDLSDILNADEGQVPAQHARNHLHVQRQGEEARATTRSR